MSFGATPFRQMTPTQQVAVVMALVDRYAVAMAEGSQLATTQMGSPRDLAIAMAPLRVELLDHLTAMVAP